MESQGRDIKLDEKRVEGYRNFATKLWNAARFLQMNGVGASDSIAAPPAELPVNRWIIGEVVETLGKLDRAFDELRYDEMADAIYHFVWGTFCDWYVELVKGELSPSPSGEGKSRESGEGVGAVGSDKPHPNPAAGSDRLGDGPLPGAPEGEGLDETRRVAAWAFDQILVMLHPLMPFITEELWHAMGERPYDLIVAKWPEPQAQVDSDAKADTDWLVSFINEVRSARAELALGAAKLTLRITGMTQRSFEAFFRNEEAIRRLARIERIFLHSVNRTRLCADQFGAEVDRYWMDFEIVETGVVQLPLPEMQAYLDLPEGFDLEAERARLSKGAAAAEKERDSLAQRLANPNFTERAKPEAVEKARSDHDAKAAEAERLRAALERLG
jgi:valyl-tRNA synthetase